MENREEHIGKMEKQLTQWGKTLDELTLKAEKAGANVKSSYRESVDDLKTKYLATKSKLEEFKTEGSESWDTFKAGSESSWNELDLAFKKLTNQ